MLISTKIALLSVTALAVVLTAGSAYTAYAHGNSGFTGPGSFGSMSPTNMMQIMDNGDYKSWAGLMEGYMSEELINEELFNDIQQMHKSMMGMGSVRGGMM